MSLAKSYARALFEAAQDARLPASDMDLIESQLGQVVELMDTSKELRTALVSPALPAKQKAEVVEAVAKKGAFHPLVASFLGLIARKERFAELEAMVDSLTGVRLASEGGVLGHVVSADPMEAADLSALAASFTKKLGRRVAFRASTDPDLLAGLKVTVNGVTYDGTLRSQLHRLRDQLVVGR